MQGDRNFGEPIINFVTKLNGKHYQNWEVSLRYLIVRVPLFLLLSKQEKTIVDLESYNERDDNINDDVNITIN